MGERFNKQSSFAKAAEDRPEIVLILQNIRSLHNVGSIFRTADAYGAAKLYLSGYTAAPPREEISKVALGAETWIPWEKSVRTWKIVEDLRVRGYQIVALEQTKKSQPITNFEPKYPIALILGNEVRGVTKAVLAQTDTIVHLPMYGRKESLNVSVAAGVALAYLRYRK